MGRTRARLIPAVAVLVAAGCVGFGPATPTTPADDGVTPSGSSIVDGVVARLRAAFPGDEGTLWSETTTNSLDGDWLLQTPDCWGQPTCASPIGFDRLLGRIEDDIAGATSVVDILTLNPLPDGAFRDAVVRGLQRTLAAGRTPTLRVLAGVYPFGTSVAQPFGDFTFDSVQTYLDDLLAAVGPDAARLPVALTRASTDQLVSWNHAKIVAVDGRAAIVGGHNMWSGSYIQTTDPVHDVSVAVSGPAADDAQRFADLQWSFACDHSWDKAFDDYVHSPALPSCPRQLAPAPSPGTGHVKILAVEREGVGIGPPISLANTVDPNSPVGCFAVPDLTNHGGAAYDAQNPGEEAMRALVRRAAHHVFISQQDITFGCPMPAYDVRMFEAIADRLLHGVKVRIVLSTPGAKTKNSTGYSNIGELADVSRELYAVAARVAGDAVTARSALCANLQLASIRFGPSTQWPNGHAFGNHAKVISVDDQAFSVGSNNLYPAWLQEFAYVVDDATAAATFTTNYLDPLWQWSRATAVIDADQSRCELAP